MIRFTPGELATRIVILDGQQHSAVATADMLASLGFRTVAIAGSAALALQLIAARSCGLVIGDLDMTPRNCRDLCLAIRRGVDSPVRSVPVVATVRAATRATVAMAREVGVSLVLVRPFSPVDLGARLAAVLRTVTRFIAVDAYVGPDRRRHANLGQDSGWRGRERRFGPGRAAVFNRLAADWLATPHSLINQAPDPEILATDDITKTIRPGIDRPSEAVTMTVDDAVRPPPGSRCFPILQILPGMQVAGILPVEDSDLPQGKDPVLTGRMVQRLRRLSIERKGPTALWIRI